MTHFGTNFSKFRITYQTCVNFTNSSFWQVGCKVISKYVGENLHA